MKISYEYPIVYLDENDPEESEILPANGVIRPIRLGREPYEAVIEAGGCSFHILFGSHCGGNFLCIPNWNVGCELSSFNDDHWNTNSILDTNKLTYEDTTAIVYALSLLNEYIKN